MSDATTDTDTELVPVLLTGFTDQDAIEINERGEIGNYDELVNAGKTFEKIRAMERSTAEKHNATIITSDDPLWREEFADIGKQDEWRVDNLPQKTA